jgi:hypothetical protein
MALIALDITAVREYSLKSDSGDNPTIFKIGMLDTMLRSAIDDNRARYAFSNKGQDAPADIFVASNSRDYDVVKFGLKGWENLLDKNSNIIPYRTDSYNVPSVGVRTGVASDLMMQLNFEWISELAGQIIDANKLTKVQEKN